jgi:NTP pyrophosphatase (non-canonical NTP hydrolase)
MNNNNVCKQENYTAKPKLGITHGRPDLMFSDLRLQNVNRCMESYHTVVAWSPTDWATGMAGECGEACNIVKKIRRLQTDSSQLPHDKVEYRVLRTELADEIADMVIYADLLCERLGINLSEAVSRKFNLTSEKVGSKRRL